MAPSAGGRRRRHRRRLTALALGPVVAVTAVACGNGPVEVDVTEPDADDAAACAALVEDLPATLADQEQRDVTPGDALAAAWGDPAVVLTCGVGAPPGFNRASQCEVAEGVGWYVPPEQYDDQELDVTLTAVEYRPFVRLVVPGDYRPSGPAAAIAELGPLVEEHLTLERRCR